MKRTIRSATAKELEPRGGFYDRMAEFCAGSQDNPGLFPTAEDMIREGRDR